MTAGAGGPGPGGPGRELQLRLSRLVRRRGSALARAGDGLPAHGRLPLGPNPLRGECYAALPRPVAHQLEALAGPRIEWWAAMTGRAPSRRPEAVLIGQDGAAFAEPRVNSAHEPIYVISGFAFAAGSLVREDVVSRPAASSPGLGPRSAPQPVPEPEPPGPGPGPAGALAVPGIGAATLEVVATLPPRAARLLTAPFTAEHPVLRSGYHYEGGDHRLDMFGVVLAGARHATFATGSRVVPHSHTERTAHWALTCIRADVTRLIEV
ncbi:MAG TPA: hypothetical protein VI248_08340 [Kineosporiaceae bacterium]